MIRAALYPDDDWQCWDGTEAVRLAYARRSASGVTAPVVIDSDQPDAVPIAKRRAIRSAEKSPTGGQYLGFETRWLIPVALLTEGIELRPADTVIDTGGTRYTVLKAQLGKLGQTWLLDTIDLVLAKDLRTTIDLERPTITFNDAGVKIKAWPTGTGHRGGAVAYQGVPANVQEAHQTIVLERGIEGFKGEYLVTIGRQVAITKEMRLRLEDGSYLDVVDYHNATRIDELPVIAARRSP